MAQQRVGHGRQRQLAESGRRAPQPGRPRLHLARSSCEAQVEVGEAVDSLAGHRRHSADAGAAAAISPRRTPASSSQGSTAARSCRPRSPSRGRWRNRTAPSARSSRKAAANRAGRSFLAARAGRPPAGRSLAAPHQGRHGQARQAGRARRADQRPQLHHRLREVAGPLAAARQLGGGRVDRAPAARQRHVQREQRGRARARHWRRPATAGRPNAIAATAAAV